MSIRSDLDDLIILARRHGKWIFSHSMAGVFWWSPDQFKAEIDKGNFLWGAGNFQLKDPREYLLETKERADRALDEYHRVRREVG